MGKYSAASGIQVLDRAVAILHAVAAAGPHGMSLHDITDTTGIPRATTHRLATALQAHDLLTRTPDSTWTIGDTLRRLAPSSPPPLLTAALPIMEQLVATTGESVQLYQLTGATRTCIAAQEPPVGLHNTVAVGSQLPLTHGSAAHVFAAHSQTDQSGFSEADLRAVRERGLAESVSEREPGLASLSAPVFDQHAELIAVLSVSGPAERLGPSPAKTWGAQLTNAAQQLTRSVAGLTTLNPS
ncbi:IclR family transcriptional regulator [Corynebacterium cystitidis]|uniref:Transcriptional regulator, IclR family n=1 Tax=Corynebacterium cystitidis DSM 20524 TaxID=1121357 RepID=A0A1H9VCE4_9CORY|nr:IclR family transcriptional regulator [Corynebacterium cystitidis]WJY82283.1 Acetate operon repressor [Corynebacterium cystitidis DSM 20524]SES19426.1 transcriptional regulator, IclR family [Corynebacterium cystitidis DSM 20524]SNV76888.1 IclR-family transcriptional regulator [Corynebacterium cystitidis]